MIVAGFTVVRLGLPMEKVNAPDTGCESAETTCQATVYVPCGRLERRFVVITLEEAPCVVVPSSTRSPVGENTRRLSGLTPTDSSNSAATWFGATATTV